MDEKKTYSSTFTPEKSQGLSEKDGVGKVKFIVVRDIR